MKAGKLYGAESIKLETFDSIESITGTITGWASKDFGNGPRIVLTLDDDAYSFIVSPTNYRVICRAWGDETNDWIGHRLTVYKGAVTYRGAEQPGICVRIPLDEPPVVNRELAASAHGNGAQLADDIPF